VESTNEQGIKPAEATVVVVVFGEEPQLRNCFDAIRSSIGLKTEIVIVENGGSESAIADYERFDDVTVLRPGRNTGFAEGCNLGAAAGTAPVIALINPDAIVDPAALRTLVDAANEPEIGIATASVRLANKPELLNSAGSVLTFSGLSWSGHFEELAADYPHRFAVAGASGAGMACRREVWDSLGGLVNEFFAYYEDTEFSIRCWQQGLGVIYVPDAVVLHHYKFSKNTEKFFLLERNRLATTLTCFETRHLIAIAPLVLFMELGLCAVAIRGGWLGEKLRAYRWVTTHRQWLRGRRKLVQSLRSASLNKFYETLSTSLSPGNFDGFTSPKWVEKLLAAYWFAARHIVRI